MESFRYRKLTQLNVKLICEIDTVNKSQNISICDFGCGDGRGTYLIWDFLNNDGIKSYKNFRIWLSPSALVLPIDESKTDI